MLAGPLGTGICSKGCAVRIGDRVRVAGTDWTSVQKERYSVALVSKVEC